MSTTESDKNVELTIEQILEHNKDISSEIRKRYSEIETLRKLIIAPCMRCPYDGVYRCEACSENNFEGFNIEDYPRRSSYI